MPKLKPQEDQHSFVGSTEKPDPTLLVMRGIYDWREETKQSIPEPAPRKALDCAHWWMTAMQEPEMPGETRQTAAVGAELRWDEGYAVRCRDSLMRWMSMPKQHREAILSGVRDDRVPYRGDTFEAYMTVWHQTMRMREVGIGAYRLEGAVAAAMLVETITKRKAR